MIGVRIGRMITDKLAYKYPLNPYYPYSYPKIKVSTTWINLSNFSKKILKKVLSEEKWYQAVFGCRSMHEGNEFDILVAKDDENMKDNVQASFGKLLSSEHQRWMIDLLAS